MQCISPIKASFDASGNITFSYKKSIPGLVPFAFPCRKCLPCRLNVAREKAIRCYHEAQINPGIFLTLTYSEEHLESPRLIYSHWQNFMKALRSDTYYKNPDHGPMAVMVTGEYGEKNKRPHWHALIFNYQPRDQTYLRTTDRGDKIFKSEFIDSLWGKNDPIKRPNEIGSITIESAGYVARYAAKKLVHGNDGSHDYHPLSRTSCKHAIGRSWIEQFYKHTFENGFVNLPNGERAKIPRYYEDWYKKMHPAKWDDYVTRVKSEITALAEKKNRKEEMDFIADLFSREYGRPRPLTRPKVKETILKRKFKQLQERLKL